MIAILDGPSRRMIRLIEHLAISEGWLTVGKIAKELECSEKTVQDDLQYIREKWGNLIEMETSFAHGIRMEHIPTSVLSFIFSEIFKEALAVRWLELVFCEPYHDLDYYAKKLHVSSSTLYRLHKKVNIFLEKHEVTVARKRSVFSIEGERELNVRIFMSTLLLEVSGHDFIRIISDDWARRLNNHIVRTVLVEYPNLSNLELYNFVVFYYVSLIRENQIFEMKEFSSQRIPSEDEIGYIQNSFPRIKKESVKRIEGSLISFKMGWQSLSEQMNVQRLIRVFVYQLFFDFKVPESPEAKERIQDLLEDMYFNHQYDGVVFKQVFNRFKYFSAAVKSQKPDLYRYLYQKLKTLSEDLTCDLTDSIDELTYWVVTTIPETLSYSLRQRVLVVSDISLEHAEFTAKFIEKGLTLGNNTGLSFDFVNRLEFSTINDSQFHLIISNCLLPDAGSPVVIMDDFPSRQNFVEVATLLNR